MGSGRWRDPGARAGHCAGVSGPPQPRARLLANFGVGTNHIDVAAARATEVFQRHRRTLEHDQTLSQGLRAPSLHFTQSLEDSKRLDSVDGFHIVIAASGMCEAGRIRHRLKRWIWSEAATVLLTGYQAQPEEPVSYTHLPSPRDRTRSRMRSSA